MRPVLLPSSKTTSPPVGTEEGDPPDELWLRRDPGAAVFARHEQHPRLPEVYGNHFTDAFHGIATQSPALGISVYFSTFVWIEIGRPKPIPNPLVGCRMVSV